MPYPSASEVIIHKEALYLYLLSTFKLFMFNFKFSWKQTSLNASASASHSVLPLQSITNRTSLLGFETFQLTYLLLFYLIQLFLIFYHSLYGGLVVLWCYATLITLMCVCMYACMSTELCCWLQETRQSSSSELTSIQKQIETAKNSQKEMEVKVKEMEEKIVQLEKKRDKVL